MANPTHQRKAIVDLYLEGSRFASIASYSDSTLSRVYEVLARSEVVGMRTGRSVASAAASCPRGRPRAIATIRRLQADPELGELRTHAALVRIGIDLSPRTRSCNLALHRDLGAPMPATVAPRLPHGMPLGRSPRITGVRIHLAQYRMFCQLQRCPQA